MKTVVLCAAALLLARSGFGQDDLEKKRKEIMEKVKAKLEETRKVLLERVAKIVDEELNKTTAAAGSPADRKKALEKKLGELKAETAKVKALLLEARLQQIDEKLYDEARKADVGPQEANDLFQESMTHHNDKKYDEAIAGFKKIVYALHDTDDQRIRNLVCIAAYNIACGYSLSGKKEEALDWLEVSINRGYFGHPDSCHDSALDHLEKDTDLDALREESRYKELVKRGKTE